MFLPHERTADGGYVYDIGDEPKVGDPAGMEEVLTNTDAEMARSLGIHEDLAIRLTSCSLLRKVSSSVVLPMTNGMSEIWSTLWSDSRKSSQTLPSLNQTSTINRVGNESVSRND